MDYVSPGGAFTSAFADAELQKAALARQAMLDDLTRKRTESEISLGQAALQEKRDEAAERIREKERAETERDVAGLAVGDIPDADLIARAKKHHVPIRTTLMDAGGTVPPQFGQTATDTTGQVRFAGTPKQADEAAKAQKIDAIVKQISGLDPSSPQFRQLATEYEMVAGKQIPATLTGKTAATDAEAVFRQNPRTGTVERLQNGQWSPWGGDVPKGAHFMTEPPPKDTSAADRQLQTVHDRAITELDKWATPIEGHLDAIRSLGTMLNAKTPEADKLVAPLVIKATIAGQGSGFRMTRAEIENVVGGRSHWETLQAALQQWSLNPSQALSLTDSQREDLRALTRKIREKATKLTRQITDARHQIDDATDVKTINRARTRLQEDLSSMDEADEDGGGTSGVPVVGGMFNGGKVLKVTPVGK